MARTVGHLKEDIKKRRPNELGTFDADAFMLYRIDQGNETALIPCIRYPKLLDPLATLEPKK